jgi:ribonuclease HI
MAKWIAPPQGMAKINVDAAVSKTGMAGAVAAVCRSGTGQFLGASAVVIQGISHPATLEVLACREALALALDLQIARVRIASDCLEVINSLEGDYMGIFSSVIREIRSREEDFEALSFVHERRTSNMEAHSLARSSIYRDFGRHVWLTQTPDELCIPMSFDD